MVPTGGDVRNEARLLRIPVETLAPGAGVDMVQHPVTGVPTPCSTPGVANAGHRPGPSASAHRPASDIVVQLNAPPGTILGPPQEVPLTGSRTISAQAP